MNIAMHKHQEARVYRNRGVWAYAIFIRGEFDHSDILGIPDNATVSVAMAEAAQQFPGAAVVRVPDTSE